MLLLKVIRFDDRPVPFVIDGRFGPDGGTIGRAPDCTMVLPDPSRRISRTHALVAWADGAARITCVGSNAVPVIVNGNPLGTGRSSVLAGGDRIRIEGYEISVESSVLGDDPGTLMLRGGQPLPNEDATRMFKAQEPAPMPSPPPPADDDAIARFDAILDAKQASRETPPPAHVEPPVAEPPAPAAPPAAATPAPAAPQAPAQPPAAAGDASIDALLQAFLAGAGLDGAQNARGPGLPTTLTPALMRQLGELLRAATHGAVELLRARAVVKQEMHAEVTVIGAQHNNPLKFSPDERAAVRQLLLTTPVRGFVDPVTAMRDAFDDLLAHQVAMIAGMRAAIDGVLQRFDPRQLEHRLGERNVLDAMLPMARRARLWERYNELFDEIEKSAQDDFDSFFGREFVRAYQEQLDHLRRKADADERRGGA